jgi:hypothetical protein
MIMRMDPLLEPDVARTMKLSHARRFTMSTYAVSNYPHDDYAEQSGRRFKTRSDADAYLAHEREMGKPAFLFRWDNGQGRQIDPPPASVETTEQP